MQERNEVIDKLETNLKVAEMALTSAVYQVRIAFRLIIYFIMCCHIVNSATDWQKFSLRLPFLYSSPFIFFILVAFFSILVLYFLHGLKMTPS